MSRTAKEILTTAEEFLREKNLMEPILRFLELENSKKIIEEEFESFRQWLIKQQASFFQQSKILGGMQEEICQFVEEIYNREVFFEEVTNTFKVFLYQNFLGIPESFVQKPQIENFFANIEEANQFLTKELKEVINQYNSINRRNFMELFGQFEPEEDEEVTEDVPRKLDAEEVLRETEAFLEQHGLKDTIQSFIEADDTKNLIHEMYANFLVLVEKIKNDVPDELKKNAEVMYTNFVETENVFTNDVVKKFAVRFKYYCENPYFAKLMNHSELKETFENHGRDCWLNEVIKEIAESYAFDGMVGVFEVLYSDYVIDKAKYPEAIQGLVEELSKYGTVVPAEVIFPDLFSEDSEEEGTDE